MKTLALIIEERPDEKGDYPVRLELWTDGDPRRAQTSEPGTLPREPEKACAAKGENPAELTSTEMLKYLRTVQPADRDASLTRFGMFLGRVLAHSAAGQKWLQERGADVRTVLAVPPSLQAYPWELARIEESESTGIFTTATAPISRWLPRRLPTALSPCDWPIRVLVVVGSTAAEEGDVSAEEEIAAIEDVAHECAAHIEVKVVRTPRREDLRLEFEDAVPHVFHFIGHCSKKDKVSVLEVESTVRYDLSAQDLAQCFKVHPPRLVVLNACETAEATDGGATWTFAEALRAEPGIGAVLGAQGDVRGKAGATLSSKLYRSLASGEAIDVAMAWARSALALDLAAERKDWFLPHLSFFHAPVEVLPPKPALGQEHEKRIRERYLEQDLKAFVDREKERRTLCKVLRAPPVPEPHRVIVLSGPEDIGKTKLMLWTMQACQVWGWDVAYVDLVPDEEGPVSISFVEALRRMRGAILDTDLGAGGKPPPDAFNAFTDQSNQLCARKEGVPPPGAAAGARLLDGELIEPPPELDARAAMQLATAFRSDLARLSTQRTFVLGLDHPRINPKQFQTFLVSLLLKPRALNLPEALNLRVIIAAPADTKDDRKIYQIDQLVKVCAAKEIVVPKCPADEFLWRAQTWLRRSGVKVGRLSRSLKAIDLDLKEQGDWSPAENFPMLEQLARRAKVWPA